MPTAARREGGGRRMRGAARQAATAVERLRRSGDAKPLPRLRSRERRPRVTLLAELGDGDAGAARPRLGFPVGGAVGQRAEELMHGAAQRAATETVHDANLGEAGAEGTVEVLPEQ